MKKHGLSKILGILLLLVVIVSFVLTGRSETKDFIGLADVALNGLKSVYYFCTDCQLFCSGFGHTLQPRPFIRPYMQSVSVRMVRFSREHLLPRFVTSP